MDRKHTEGNRPIDLALKWAEALGWTQVRLAQEIGATPADITNWKDRGMPPRWHQPVAKAMGRTVDELLSGQPGAQQNSVSKNPNATVADVRVSARELRLLVQVTTVEARALQAFRLLPDNVRSEYLDNLERAVTAWQQGELAQTTRDVVEKIQLTARIENNNVETKPGKTRQSAGAARHRKGDAKRK